MSAVGATSTGKRVGRFRLIRELGRGAQAVVWRAHDERLERDVALKLLSPGADTVSVAQWLHEARAVSRLAHPNIVPVFEADEYDGQPYLVFELVEGEPLSDALRKRGAMQAAVAVQCVMAVLAALAEAHGHGIVHRDLKPSNILVDEAGRARVMDFGIAARVSEVADGLIVGTPGYISPEAAQGLPPTPQMDVFSAGMLLAEMLTGAPLLRERDPHRALHRVVHEDLALTDDIPIDDGLRAVVLRALQRDASLRYPSAAEMREALRLWLEGRVADGSGATAGTAAGSGTLDFLLRRMRSRTDFPTLSDSVVRIQRIAASERESLNSLAVEILKDVALTNKLLRMVNTVHYSSAGGGTISTVSRAVALVGFAGIRNMALSLLLFEHMKDKAHAKRLREEFLRSLVAGQIAGELATSTREAEEAFLGAMFHNLGRLLCEYYLPEEAQQIRDQVSAAGSSPDNPRTVLESAAERVLGLGFERLGMGVARSWGLPDSLQRCMLRGDAQAPARPAERGLDRLRWVSVVANELADVTLDAPPDQAASRIEALVSQYGRALALDARQMQEALSRARSRLAQLAPAMGLSLPSGWARGPSAAGAVATAPQSASKQPAPARDIAGGDALAQARTIVAPRESHSGTDGAMAGDAPRAGRKPADREVLSTGIHDITQAMASDSCPLAEVLRMVLDVMHRGMGFQRVLLALKDPRGLALVGRVGLGLRVDEACRVFRVELPRGGAVPSDLFQAICQKGADTVITDARVPSIAQRLPAWYQTHVGAPAFLLLPMALKGAPFGLIYGDVGEPGSWVVDERELALVRTLRNQAVMALRQAA